MKRKHSSVNLFNFIFGFTPFINMLKMNQWDFWAGVQKKIYWWTVKTIECFYISELSVLLPFRNESQISHSSSTGALIWIQLQVLDQKGLKLFSWVPRPCPLIVLISVWSNETAQSRLNLVQFSHSFSNFDWFTPFKLTLTKKLGAGGKLKSGVKSRLH